MKVQIELPQNVVDALAAFIPTHRVPKIQPNGDTLITQEFASVEDWVEKTVLHHSGWIVEQHDPLAKQLREEIEQRKKDLETRLKGGSL